MELKRFFYTDTGKIIISIILGLGLASLFRIPCKGKKCLSFKGLKKQDLNKTYKYGDKCFNYSIDPVVCGVNKRTLKIE